MSKNDMLAIKQRELSDYRRQFDDAVSVVTNTITRLELINERTEQKIREIEEYQAQLQETKDGLTEAKDKNARVISNFRTLLCE